MSLKHYRAKKIMGAVFNDNSGPSVLLAGALTAAAPIYAVVEAVLSDASPERTPGIGDRQMVVLEKALAETVTLSHDKTATAKRLDDYRQEHVIDADKPDIASAVQAMDEDRQEAATAFNAAGKKFVDALLMSQGISEIDARNLVSDYQRASSLKIWGGHSFSYLDECQQQVTSAGSASDVALCMDEQRWGHQFVAGVGGLLGGGWLAYHLLALMFGLGSRYREEVWREDLARKVEEKEVPKPPETKSDEVILKIKIDIPKL